MVKQIVNIGALANDGTGDPVRSAFQKTTANFDELYTALGDGAELNRLVLSLPTLLADTALTYTPDLPGTVVAGDIVRTQAEGISYEVAASGATDQHVTTVGGVKLYVVEAGADVRAFGAKADNATDDTAAVQAMVDAFGRYVLPRGTCRITDTIVLPTSGSMPICIGQGMEVSALNYQGVSGKPAVSIGVAGVTSYSRVYMRDHSIIGAADTAFRAQMTDPGILYNSSFENMRFTATGSAFVCNNIFSSHFTGCRFNVTVNGHGIDLWCGPSVVLTDCYPEIVTGASKAGFRIRTSATLIGCNGLNSGEIWAVFGNSSSESSDVLAGAPNGGGDAQFQATLIGCNMEDFTKYAIGLRFQGRLVLGGGNTFIPKGDNTYETYVDAVSCDADTLVFVDFGSTSFPKAGAVRSKASFLVTYGATVGFGISAGQIFSNYRSELAGVNYNLSYITGEATEFGVRATRFEDLTFRRAYGFVSQIPTTWTVNATTMSVARRNTIKTVNTVATQLEYASGGVEGQRLTILVKDANTTIKHDLSFGGRFINKSGADYLAANGDVYEYVFNGTNWFEV